MPQHTGIANIETADLLAKQGSETLLRGLNLPVES